MNVFDNISCSDEWMDTPSWVAVDLSDVDQEHIAKAQDILENNPWIGMIEFTLRGKFAMEETEGVWKYRDLRITSCGGLWLRVMEKHTGSWIEVWLGDDVSSIWEWDDKTKTVKEI